MLVYRIRPALKRQFSFTSITTSSHCGQLPIANTHPLLSVFNRIVTLIGLFHKPKNNSYETTKFYPNSSRYPYDKHSCIPEAFFPSEASGRCQLAVNMVANIPNWWSSSTQPPQNGSYATPCRFNTMRIKSFHCGSGAHIEVTFSHARSGLMPSCTTRW